MKYFIREGKVKGVGRYWSLIYGGTDSRPDWVYNKRCRAIFSTYERADFLARKVGGRVISLLTAAEAQNKAKADALRLAAQVMWERERKLLKKPKSKMSFIDVAVAQTYASCALINVYTAENIWPTPRRNNG